MGKEDQLLEILAGIAATSGPLLPPLGLLQQVGPLLPPLALHHLLAQPRPDIQAAEAGRSPPPGVSL